MDSRPDVSKSDAQLEEWFLANVQQADVPLSPLLDVLKHFRSLGRLGKAEACADLLQECLVERQDCAALLTLFALRASWHTDDRIFASACEKWLSSVFQNTPSVLRYIPHLGFDKGISPTECLRRLQVLHGLQLNALCYEKTRGLGVVCELDEYMNQVVIDFRTKKQHRMSFAYAAEALQLLGEDHVLVEQYRDPKAFAGRVEGDPAGLVKSVIRDFGPMSISSLQELMVGNMISPSQWKTFWENARKQLKRDPLFVMPAKRSESLRVLEKERLFDDHWISSFQQERDLGHILDLTEELKGSAGDMEVPGSLRNAVEDRLRFVMLSAGRKKPGIAAHALLLADELGLKYPEQQWKEVLDCFLNPEIMLTVIRVLPVRILARFLPFLAAKYPGRTETQLLHLIPDLTLSDMNTVVDCLLALHCEARVADQLRELVKSGRPSIGIIGWLCRHIDFVFKNSVCEPDRLVLVALTALETGHPTGEDLKATNQVQACFLQTEWLKTTISSMDNLQRSDFVLRLRNSRAWQESDRNALLARLVALFPELREESQDKKPEVSRPRVTSLRSYSERQVLLRKIITEDIPRNTQDIATARSYGDLSENYEYHAARETQGMLMGRRNELERMLGEVRGITFENASRDTAGMGTCVTLRHSDGSTERYVILGEWDHDDKLGIISSGSGLAQILEGHKAGDEVLIPKETGHAHCVISDISGLTDEIKEWIQTVLPEPIRPQ